MDYADMLLGGETPKKKEEMGKGTDYASMLLGGGETVGGTFRQKPGGSTSTITGKPEMEYTSAKQPFASFGTRMKASFADQPLTRVKIYAESRGIPISRYRVNKTGQIEFKDDEGNWQRETAETGESKFKTFAAETLAHPSTYTAPIGAIGGPTGAVIGAMAGEAFRKVIGKSPLIGNLQKTPDGMIRKGQGGVNVEPTYGEKWEGEDLLDIGMQGIFALGGEMSGKLIGYGVNRYLGRGAGILKKAGQEATRGLLTPVDHAKALLIKQLADQHNITLAPHQLYDKEGMTNLWKYLRKHPLTSDAVRTFEDKLSGQTDDAIQGFINQMGGYKETATGLGEKIKGTAEKIIDKAEMKRSKAVEPLYKKAVTEAEGGIDISSVTKKIDEVIDSYPEGPSKKALLRVKNSLETTRQSATIEPVTGLKGKGETPTVTTPKPVGGKREPWQITRGEYLSSGAEIDTSGARYKFFPEPTGKLKPGEDQRAKLGDILDFPELYERYPYLKDYPVFRRNEGGGQYGAHAPGEISINEKRTHTYYRNATEEQKNKLRLDDARENLETILHELQHEIDFHEMGFRNLTKPSHKSYAEYFNDPVEVKARSTDKITITPTEEGYTVIVKKALVEGKPVPRNIIEQFKNEKWFNEEWLQGKIKSLPKSVPPAEEAGAVVSPKLLSSHIPETDLRKIQKAIFDLNDLIEGTSQEAAQIAPSSKKVLNRDLSMVKEDLLKIIGEAAPSFAKANRKYEKLSAPIDRLKSGVIGELTRIQKDAGIAKAPHRLLDVSNMPDAELLTRARKEFEKTDPELWKKMVGGYIRDVYEGLKVTEEGKVINAAGKLQKRLFGSDKQRQIMKAAMTPDEYRNFEGLMTIFQRASIGTGKESMTAPFQQIEKQISGELGSKAYQLASQPKQALVDWSFGKWNDMILSGKQQELLTALQAPDVVARLSKMKKLTPGSRKLIEEFAVFTSVVSGKAITRD